MHDESEHVLKLEIGEGFDDDDLRVLVDGREVWHGEGLTTNYSVGLADVVDVPVGTAEQVIVEVQSSDGFASTYPVDFSATRDIRLRYRRDSPSGRAELGPAPEGPLF